MEFNINFIKGKLSKHRQTKKRRVGETTIALYKIKPKNFAVAVTRSLLTATPLVR